MDNEKREPINMSAPREDRARRFARTILSFMQDFLPNDPVCQQRAYEHLLDAAHEGNVEIINVPPEWDHMNKMQIERAKIETHPIFVAGSQTIHPTETEDEAAE